MPFAGYIFSNNHMSIIFVEVWSIMEVSMAQRSTMYITVFVQYAPKCLTISDDSLAIFFTISV